MDTRTAPLSVHLPPFLGDFVERSDETAEIKALLATARLFTLTGTGGSGKTRLAAQLAARLHDQLAHGVRWIDLGALADPALVAVRVAEVCGVAEQVTLPALEALIAALRPQQMLLVLDNCEHLLPACAALAATLLAACHDLRILATSREPLAIPGEVIWLVAPLAVPAPHSDESVEALETYAGVQLFVARATAALPEFRLTPQNAATVAKICRQVAGLPLALELAAAQLRSLSLDDLAARLDDSLRLLTRGSRTAPPRQQTLRAALDWSYDLLTEPERLVFCRLAVFAGSFAAPAAEAIGANPGVPEVDVLDILARLVEQSLVTVQDRVGETRYRLLEPLRQYAQGRLVESEQLQQTQQRHRDWYANLARSAARELLGPNQGAWLDRLAREHDNIRTALGWSLTQHDAAGAGAMIAGIWPFWLQRGHLREGRHWLGQTLAALPEPTPLRALLLWIAGIIARPDARQAQQVLAESLALYQQLGNQAEAVRPLVSLAGVTLALGDHKQAISYFEQSLPVVRAADDTLVLVRVLLGLALGMIAVGDTERALALCHEALALAQQVGDQRAIGAALANLGLVWEARGDDQQASELWSESLALRRRIGDQGGVAHVLTLQGALALREQAHRQAVELFCESLLLRQRMGEYDGIPPILEGLAALAIPIGALDVAAQLAGAAAAIRTTTGVQHEQIAHQQTLATLRNRLAESTFAQAWAEGQRLALEQCVQLAHTLRSSINARGLDESATDQPPRANPAQSAAAATSNLTAREIEVLGLLTQGLTYAQIGEQLMISSRTVDAHLRAIFSKLGVRSRTAATRIAIEQRLV
jgi:non-specific serine/threonine protein kinase